MSIWKGVDLMKREIKPYHIAIAVLAALGILVYAFTRFGTGQTTPIRFTFPTAQDPVWPGHPRGWQPPGRTSADTASAASGGAQQGAH